MIQNREWAAGERVVHTGRPEWGVGQVVTAEPVVQDGKRCQRLTLRFDRAGTKTLSTAYASLAVAQEGVELPRAVGEIAPDPLAAASSPLPADWFTQLPEPATDPFSGMKRRLTETLNLYRFTGHGGSLLDWAAMQTGMKDPLSRYSRHELEVFFKRFQGALDEHLRRLLRDMRKQDPAAINEVVAAANPAAKTAVRRADAMR